jgi:diacylglycerol O-acyltransferase / wax synthase
MGARVGPRIERVSANDRTTLVTDHGPAPMNIGAVLIVENGDILDFSTVQSLLRSRLPRVRRMRQRLLTTPFGCGGPLWVDDPRFNLDRHLRETTLLEATGTTAGQEPVGDDRLLRVAADLACTRLSREKALWTALWVTGLTDDHAALILVMHHAMTDGVGGLAVLAALADNSIDPSTKAFPEPCPSLHDVAINTW